MNNYFKYFSLKLTATSCFIICALIFLLSLYVRSVQDIGGDTGFYLELGKKIAGGGRYYYDFFESNFPISFFIYAWQYKVSKAIGISPIIMSEIFVNVFALLSLAWSYAILKKSPLNDNINHLYLIIIAFFLGFFLRIGGTAIGEFGTKTSFVLILLMPYISYSFIDHKNLDQRNLVFRGILMGLIPCFKPHYAIIIIVVEFLYFFKEKNWRFFITIDKLYAILVMALYLNFLLIYSPEYLEFMIPMWKNFYSGYADLSDFFDNIAKILATKILLFALVIPVFIYLKIDRNDKIYIAFYIGFSLLLLLESLSTIDQEVFFYFITTAFLFKIIYDFIKSGYVKISDNKFIIFTFLIIPYFDVGNSYKAIFGTLTTWWLIIAAAFIHLIFKYKVEIKNKKSLLFLYFFLTLISILAVKYLKRDVPVLLCYICFTIFLFIYEEYYKQKNQKCSKLLIILICSIISLFSHSYFKSIKDGILKDCYFSSPTSTTDKIAYYIKKYAPKEQDSYLTISNWIAHQFPLINYFDKPYNYKYAATSLYDRQAQNLKTSNGKTMFSVKNKERGFTYNYLFDSLKEQIRDKNLKVIFVNTRYSGAAKNACGIGLLEYYFKDPEFKKIFFENFTFKNHIIEYKEYDEIPKRIFKPKDEFDKLEKSKTYIIYDFEVYIRK